MNTFERYFKINNVLKNHQMGVGVEKGSIEALEWVDEIRKLYHPNEFPTFVQWIINLKISKKCTQVCDIEQLDEFDKRIEKHDMNYTIAITSFIAYLSDQHWRMIDKKNSMVDRLSKDDNVSIEELTKQIEKEKEMKEEQKLRKELSEQEYQQYLKEKLYKKDYTKIPASLFENVPTKKVGLKKDSNERNIFGYVVTEPIYGCYGVFIVYVDLNVNQFKYDFLRIENEEDIETEVEVRFMEVLMEYEPNQKKKRVSTPEVDIDHVKKAMGMGNSDDPIQNRINNDLNGDIF